MQKLRSAQAVLSLYGMLELVRYLTAAEWKQAHVGMELSKANQTRQKQYHNTFTPSLKPYKLCIFVANDHNKQFEY